MTIPQSCSNCDAWRRWAGSSQSPKHGDCRDDSPKVLSESDPASGLVKARTKFPSTHEDGWCRRHEPLIPPARGELPKHQ